MSEKIFEFSAQLYNYFYDKMTKHNLKKGTSHRMYKILHLTAKMFNGMNSYSDSSHEMPLHHMLSSLFENSN